MDKKPKTKAEFDALSFDDKLMLYYQYLGTDAKEADWTTAFKNNLPDISFAVIEKGGKKDSGGKTVPRSYRHLPHHAGISKHTATNTDEPHLKNAAARVNQLVSVSSSDNTARLKSSAKAHLRSHYRAHNMELPDVLKASAEIESPLVESYSTDITILELDEKDEGIVARARFKISETDKRNRNGRVYPRDVWEAQVQRFRRGTVTGQDGHPGLFSPVKVTDAFLIFDKLEIIDGDVMGEADVLGTQQGTDFVTVAKAGAKIAVSTRGFGSIERTDKWTDGKPAAIVQDDYKLFGVDVMFDGYQSVPTAKMRSLTRESLSFIHESVDPQEYERLLDDMEITPEYLNENYPDVVHELVHEHEHRVEELEAEIESIQAEKEGAEAKVDVLQAQIDEQANTSQAELDAAEARAAGLDEQIVALTNERDTATERANAHKYVFETVVGEPAAMLMAKELLAFETVADVKANFPRVKREAERILASTPVMQTRSLYVPDESDQAHGRKDAPEKDPEKARVLKWAGMAQ